MMMNSDKVLWSILLLIVLVTLWTTGYSIDESASLVLGVVSGFYILKNWVVKLIYDVMNQFKKETDTIIITTKRELKYNIIPGGIVILSSFINFLLMYLLHLKSFFLMGIFLTWLVCGLMILTDREQNSFLPDRRKE